MSGSAGADEWFARGFDRSGRALLPVVEDGVLWCFGHAKGSGARHRCRFVAVDGAWVWEHRCLIVDVVRFGVGAGALEPRHRQLRRGRPMRSVSAIGAEEGALVEVVDAVERLGRHVATGVARLVVRDGALAPAGRNVPAALAVVGDPHAPADLNDGPVGTRPMRSA
ncbi:MAG: hypothetical protein M0010_03910 [Actinomycetota bacterium]|nr:hypothetical protein [Actinomycetota bacterium]